MNFVRDIFVGGAIYDLTKFAAKSEWERIKRNEKIIEKQNTIDRERYANDPEFRRQCDEEWKIMMYKDLF